VDELETVRLTPAVRRTLTALAAAGGAKLSVRQISTAAHLSPVSVRAALTVMGRAKLVQHVLAPSEGQLPPRTVYWLTGGGYDVAAAGRPDGQSR
jgi:hypothetical protein